MVRRPGTWAVALAALASVWLLREASKAFVSGSNFGQGRRLSARRASAEPVSAEPMLSNQDFFWGSGYDQSELEEAALKLSQSSSDALWEKVEFGPDTRPAHLTADAEWTPLPKEQRWMDLPQFVAAQAQVGSSEMTSNALFTVLSQGSGYLEKPKVEAALQSWASSDKTLNQVGWSSSVFWAKAQIAFGYAWLYGMSSFCGYFFFFRPPLFIFFGIDLLPGTPQWWAN